MTTDIETGHGAHGYTIGWQDETGPYVLASLDAGDYSAFMMMASLTRSTVAPTLPCAIRTKTAP